MNVKTMRLSVAAAVAVAAIWIVVWSARTPQEQEPLSGVNEPEVAQPLSASKALPQHGEPDTVLLRAEVPAVNEKPKRELVPPPERASATLGRVRSAGIDIPVGFGLPDEQAWDQFIASWEAMTKEVDDARRQKYDIGVRLAQQRLKAGSYVTHETAGYPNGLTFKPGMTETRPWMILNHVDEWKTCVDDGSGIIKVVRIPPGESGELDAATAGIHAALGLRKRDCEYYFGLYTRRQQGEERRRDGLRWAHSAGSVRCASRGDAAPHALDAGGDGGV